MIFWVPHSSAAGDQNYENKAYDWFHGKKKLKIERCQDIIKNSDTSQHKGA